MDWYRKFSSLEKAAQEQGDLFQGFPESVTLLQEPPPQKSPEENQITYLGYRKQPAGYAEVFFSIYNPKTKDLKKWAYMVDPDIAEKVNFMSGIKGIGNKAFVEAKKWRKAEWQVDENWNPIPGTLNKDV